MKGDPTKLANQLEGYHEFVSDFKLYHTIVAGHVHDPWFSNLHNLKHFFFFRITFGGVVRQ